MEYDQKDQASIINQLESLAMEKEYSKILLKIPDSAAQYFIGKGYKVEGRIVSNSQGGENLCFLSKFLSVQRSFTDKQAEYNRIISISKSKKLKPLPPIRNDFTIMKMTKDQSEEMSSLYQDVFKTYPFPISDPAYIQNTIDTNVVYFGVYYGKVLAALGSSEINEKYKNAEMTDFAARPQYRGEQLAKHLLWTMEKEMFSRDITSFYTIARSESLPMNCTFASSGYHFGGTLINNTQISGKLESMNIWFK